MKDIESEGIYNGIDPYHRGSNQSGMRVYNERVVLTLLRRHGSLAKADITRLTGLSAQAVSIIMRKLEAEGLLQRGKPTRIRGKAGQPSIPMSLAPGGAYFFGLKIGWRSSVLVLIDFLGKIVDQVQQNCPYPTPENTVQFALEGIAGITENLIPAQRDRIAGLGIGVPFRLWDFVEEIGAPPGAMESWRNTDIRELIEQRCSFPVYLENDATAACGAELVFGQTYESRDFLYFYVGYLIGGGIVLNGSLYTGRTKNAGALGSMPVPIGNGNTKPLVDVGSICQLESAIKEAAGDSVSLWKSPSNWAIPSALLDAWIDSTSRGIAHAVEAAASVVDFEESVIDGWLPPKVRARLVEAVQQHLQRKTFTGIEVPRLREGSVGFNARELGAASLPLSSRFLVDQYGCLMRSEPAANPLG
jgi:predicted NBD/HSP70 family sugar kinase